MHTPVRQRLLLSAVSNWLAFAATMLVSFFMTPYMIRRLGDGPYGVWAFVESLLAYLTLFDLGIAACVVRFVAKFRRTGEADRLRGLLSTTWFLFWGLAAGVLVVGGAVVPWSVAGMESGGVPRGEAVAFGLLMLANLSATLPLSVFPAILDGLERYGSKSLVRLVVLAGRTAGFILVVENGGTLWEIGLVVTAANLAEHIACAVLCRRFLPAVRFRVRDVNRESFHEIRGYSLNAFLAMIGVRITAQSGPLIVAAVLGMGPVTAFAVVARLVDMAKSLLRQAITTLTPAVSSMDAAGKHAEIAAVFVKATRFVLYLILPVQVGLVIFGEVFLNLWLKNPAYGEQCYGPLVVLSLPLALAVAQSVAARILFGTGRLTAFARVCLLEAAANVVLSVVLCQAFGLIGLVWGIVIPNVAANVWTVWAARQQLQLSWGEYLRGGWLKPLLTVIVPVALWWPLAGNVNSWGTLFGIGLAGLAPYAAVIAGLEWVSRRPRGVKTPRPRGCVRGASSVQM